MALSCYSNWRGELEHFNSQMIMFAQPQPELSSELVSFNSNLALSDPYIHPLLESHDLFCSDDYISLLPAYFSSPSDNISNGLCSLIPEVFQEVEYEPYLNPKCQKAFEGSYNNAEIVAPGLCNGFVPNPSLFQEPTPEILSSFAASFASNPPIFSSGRSTTETVKKSGNGGTSSAQSIAARQRRRKITEKTRELGKLIPGGHKMNTAEMFQAAFKYIKFLQAQVGILETLGSAAQENGESFQNQELNPLLGSCLIQEKLYSMEKCLVPNKFVQSLENDNRLQSNPQALQEFQEMIGISS